MVTQFIYNDLGLFYVFRYDCDYTFLCYRRFVLKWVGSVFQSRNYRLKRNGNSANFSSYVGNGKKIKELFAFTLNGITASVGCVSSMIVVLNAKLPD